MKLWTSKHTFDHPWETVISAQFQKYPNPFNKAVTAVDVLERCVDKSGILKSQRLVQSTFVLPIPRFVSSLIPDQTVYALEKSEVNPKDKTFTLKSINMSYDSFLSIDETMVYSPHPTDKSKTVLQQETIINVCQLPLSNFLENEVINTVSKNTEKGRQAVNWVIEQWKNGCTDLRKEFQNCVDNVLVHGSGTAKPM